MSQTPAWATHTGEATIYPTEAELRKLGVPSDEIIDAFQLELNRVANAKWWQERMGNTRRYKKLAAAFVQKGLPSRGDQRYPSWWRPDLIASWLIQSRHMPSYKALPILRKRFPQWANATDNFYLSYRSLTVFAVGRSYPPAVSKPAQTRMPPPYH
jgi:hypothetical protein